MRLPPCSLIPPVLVLLAGCQLQEMALDAPGAPGAALKSTTIPLNLTVTCDGFVQSGGFWVPSSNPGPVTVYETYDATQSRYVPVYCEYISQVDRGQRELIDAPGATTWWWDYLRGQWPYHQAIRIVAGSSVQGDPGKGSNLLLIPLWTVVFQRVTVAGNTTAERIFVLDGPAGMSLSAWMDQSPAPPVALNVGQYASIQNIGGVDQLGPATTVPPLGSEADPNGPAHFVDTITKDAGNRRLPNGVP